MLPFPAALSNFRGSKASNRVGRVEQQEIPVGRRDGRRISTSLGLLTPALGLVARGTCLRVHHDGFNTGSFGPLTLTIRNVSLLNRLCRSTVCGRALALCLASLTVRLLTCSFS